MRVCESQSPLSIDLSLSSSKSCWKDPSSDMKLANNGHCLIPGLPDDLALLCLLRFPVETHNACKAVSKRWYLLFCNKGRFFTRRKELGFNQPWLFVHAFCRKTAQLKWRILDLTHLSWHSIKEMPSDDEVYPQGYKCVSIPNEGVVYVCGGLICDGEFPLENVMRYEMGKDRWEMVKEMNTARCFFAGGLIDGLIYVSGGNSLEQLFELDSTEVYDPKDENWRSLANMETYIACYDSVVLDGKLLVTEGWLWPFNVSPRGQVYDPKTDVWEEMAVGLREGWTGPGVVVLGRLFVVSEHERIKVKVYDKVSDSWEAIEGPSLPEEMCKPFAVTSCDSRIFVVGKQLHVAMGHISRIRRQHGCDEEKWCFKVRWDVISASETLCELQPSSSHVLFA